MRLKKLLNKDIQHYINANLQQDLHSLLLKKSNFQDVSMQEIAQQIQGKKIAERKFPFLLQDNILFPPHLNLEQSSSEATGIYKQKLCNGQSFIDLTSGFGIDSFFLSKDFDSITLVEQNTELLEIVQHNWGILNRKATFINQKLEDFLANNDFVFDVVYLDPARRDMLKKKVFLLEDLSPNVLDIQSQLMKIGKKVVMKLSPLIDLTYLLSVLDFVTEVHIVALKNEVKEIIVIQEKDRIVNDVEIICVNLDSNEPEFSFKFQSILTSIPNYGEVDEYLYIPNNAILKSGAFNLISDHFQIKKLHPNTQLFSSTEKINQFPGRILKVKKINAKEIRKGDKYNIISKNYPLKPEEIKKKYQIKDGGQDYIIFTQDQKGKVICKTS